MTMLRVSMAAALLAGCSPTGPDEADQLRRNMVLWEARGPAQYEVVIQRSSCECLPEWLLPIRLTVSGQQVLSVVDDQTRQPITDDLYHAMSVDELFALIQDALARSADRVAVTYHPVLGYPTSIFIDYDRAAVDEELTLSVRDLLAVD
jgi:hypothetical protein